MMPLFGKCLFHRRFPGRSRPRLRPGDPARHARPRLVVEPLEDRCTPSTLTVANLLDHGDGSPRSNAATTAGGGLYSTIRSADTDPAGF